MQDTIWQMNGMGAIHGQTWNFTITCTDILSGYITLLVEAEKKLDEGSPPFNINIKIMIWRDFSSISMPNFPVLIIYRKFVWKKAVVAEYVCVPRNIPECA